MKKLFPHPVLTLALLVVWLLLNNTIHPGHVVLGLVLGIFIPWFTSSFWPERVCVRQPLTLLRFLVRVIWDILVANVVVAKLILGPNRSLRPGFFTLKLEATHPLAISLLANTISLTPGTVSCDLSRDRKELLIHALHLEDEADTITQIKERYEKPLMEVFRSC
jgi:multicomponent K+:H+ antiporter subunit E